METVDLTNCDREPIHIPGKIQNHGFIIALDDNLAITHCSCNVAHFLNTEAEKLLGRSVSILEEIISPNRESFINELIRLGMTVKGFIPLNPYPVYIQNTCFNLLITRSGDFYILEFEPELSDIKKEIQSSIGASISEMLADADLEQLLFNTATQIKKIIEYDRVMIYKFHEDGHGEVVAEEKRPDLIPFLRLHYPASDIPRQARDLYKINLIRLISNVKTEPSAVISVVDSTQYPLDLTHIGLRAVSPIHIQYLKNMGVDSSFSISLMDKDELWGLIACHNYTPRYINYKQRETAKLIGQVLSSAISFRNNKEDESGKYRFKLKLDELTKNLLRDDHLHTALLNHQTTLLDVVDASGAVLIYDKSIFSIGQVPPESFIIKLVAWLKVNSEQVIFHSDNFPQLFPESETFRKICSGVLACRINRELDEYIIWFRPEIISTIQWAGNPEKPALTNPLDIMQISPRTSFDAWSQEVRMTSAAWTVEEMDSAMHLREEVNFTINRKATELRVLNEKLKIAYDELNTFSHTVSHDLRNPLSSVKGFIELLLMEEETLTEDMKFILGRALVNANKMEIMIREILKYSKAGSLPVARSPVNMKIILEEIKQELIIGMKHPELEIIIGHTPLIHGDPVMVNQIFSNIIGNAVKYSGKQDKPMVTVSGGEVENGIQYCIRDNGIGIKADESEKIFGLFSRSAQAAEFEGSGVGLAIVQKLVKKHEGRVWVESEPGQGSSFFIFFKN
jgi:two-component system, chemotaxis family, sensor kinase Cph1